MKRTALVLGANGLIGNLVVDILLKNTNYDTVYAVSRKGIQNESNKLIQILASADNISEKINNIQVDDFFSCIGSTKAQTPNKEVYYKIDHDYPVRVAKQLKNDGCDRLLLVSSLGANIKSNNFYLKLKGETEQSIADLGIASTFVFRPSLIIGERKERRSLEHIMQKLSPILDFFLFGSTRDYKSIRAETIAKAMVNTALSEKTGFHIYKPSEIKELA